MYRIGGTMELVGLAKEEGLLISWLPEGLGIELSKQKLESLKRQYEAEMDALRQQLEVQREHSDHVDHQLRSQYSEAMSSLRQALQDSGQQKELDAVVGQLQELHQRQLQQLNAQHLHDTALQVAAMRVTVEQVQTSRLKLLEQEHRAAVQDMDKQHKEHINTLQARLSSQDDTFPLSASEELTQQYQKLVQKINQSLENEVLHHLHVDQNREGAEDQTDSKVNDISTDTISVQQAEAIQHALQTQQEEVLSLRSKLLQEYETMLQHRSEGVSQQTEEIKRLQDEMAQLQEQYQTQIEQFQTRIAQYSKEEEQHRAQQQQHEHELEEMKASYEQRITDLENTFSSRISALGQNAGVMVLETLGDGGDSGQQVDEDSFELDLSSKLPQARDYVHQTATLTAISDDSDTLDSPRADTATASSSPPASAKVLELQEVLRDKTALLVELEKCLQEERERVSDLTSQLDVESKKLRSLSHQLEQQLEASRALEKSLAEKDEQLEQAQQEQAESQKLLQELTEKESETQKEKEEMEERLKQLEEMRDTEDELSTSTPKMEEELQKLTTSLKDSTSALWAADTRERMLQEKLAEAEHRHAEALTELKQELEHEAQIERETLESEFKVQLDIELKRQAAELEKQFREQQAGKKTSDSAYISHTASEADTWCVPDAPHSEEVVQVTLTSSLNITPPPEAAQKTVITNSELTSDQCSESSQPSQENELNGSVSSEVTKSDRLPGESESVLCAEESGIQSTPPSTTTATVVVTSAAGSSTPPGGANTTSLQLVDRQLVEAELRTDFDSRVAELQQEFEAEKAQLVQAHQEKVSELEARITDAEESYRKLKEDVEEQEGAAVDTLLKDRYDMELDLAKNLMQKEFDDTLQAEKKKFVERHRKLMDDFMSDREAEAEDIKQKHQQELEELRTTLSSLHDTQITSLQAELEQLQQAGDKENSLSPRDSEELSKLQKQLDKMKERLEAAEAEHSEAIAALQEEHNNRITALKTSHQEQLEAAALDTEVVKSELEQANQAEVKSLQEQLRQWQAREEVSESPRVKGALKHAWHEPAQSSPGPEAMHDVSEISFPLQLTFQDAGDGTPETRSSLEYEETDEEGSVHSFSSVVGKTRSFADVVKTSPPASSSKGETEVPAQDEDRVKQLEAQVERLTQQLAQQLPVTDDTLNATLTSSTASPPPSARAAETGATAGATKPDQSDQNLLAMLQQDLDRINAERNAVQQTNNRLLQLLSDSVHTYVEVEDTINRRLHSVVAASSSSSMARPHTPTHQSRDAHFDLVTPRGAGLASFSSVGGDRGAIGGARAMSSPQSDRSWRQREADTGSPTLEETSILSNATDEGLDISQRLTESIFVGPDIDAEGEEIVSDARGRLQNAVTRLLEMIERTTQQLMDAKATQGDLLDNMATRSKDNSDLSTRLHDLEEQIRQEIAAKEYLGLELHKAEGLISGYSSEREALEEQLQALEEQKEVLASELETTRSRLQEFQDATGELEARRQDVERQQSLLQENTGQEVQESAMAGGDASVSEQKALLTEMDSLKQDSRDQTLQLQHRLTTTQHRLQERETTLEEMEKEHQRQVEELRRQTEDVQLQLENTERQLKSNKLFLDEQMVEREQEREEFNKEVDQLKTKLLNKEKQSDTEGRLQREIQDLSEQLQARIDSQSLMHQQTRELQQTLQERDLSAQDLKVWINTLEKELDQRGDTEDELKGRIQKLERRLTINTSEGLSDTSSSPTITPRPVSPSASTLSPTYPTHIRRDSKITLEDELRRARRNEEELVHEKEALQHTVQEQMLQISALRNQLDEMRHWKGTDLNNTSSSTTTADLRDQLDTERERLEKAEEELNKMKSDQESLEKELEEKRQEMEHLRQQVQDSTTAAQRVKELEEERTTLQNRIAELSDAGPFPPELLEEKNAEIEELQQQLSKAETECESLQAQLEVKEELVSDLQDTVHSLQRGEACLDVSLPFNEPLPLNASFTERFQEDERPSSVTSLAQELDMSVGDREARINELSAEVEYLTIQLTEQEGQLDRMREEKSALEDELRQRDEDLSQLQEEKALKQEALVEKDSRMEQMLAQVNSLHTEITSLTSFQVELQKDFDTVQSMLDEKEKEIEALTKELLETRSQTEGSDISDLEAELAAVQRQLKEQRNVIDEKEEELYELNEQLETMETKKKEVQDLKAQLEKDKSSHAEVQQALSEKTEELEKERKRRRELQQELEEMQLAERAGRGRAHSYPSINFKPLEEQVRELRAEVFHLENAVKEKEELIHYLEEEKATEGSLKEKELANLHQQLTTAQDDMAAKVAKVTELEQALKDKEEELAASETQKQQELENLQQQLSKQAETVQQLESEQKTLQQQAQEHSTEASSLRSEVSRLEEELAKNASVATGDVKALQEKLHQAGQRLTELEQEVTSAQDRLHQTSTQLSEREDQIQQLQAEVQTLQQDARERQHHDSESQSLPKTPESGEDSEGEERLKDVLTRAQCMQTLVKDSLSTSLPINSREDDSSLSRWESEPGLSSVTSPAMAARAQATEGWLRRQQRELAAKNRELATVRAELETWLRRKDRSAPVNDYSASIMTMTLRLQEKDLIITSLKRELKETQELLSAVTKSNTDTSLTSGSHSLSPQTKQQIAHLRSELRRAKSALKSMQEHSGSESEGVNVEYDRERMQKMEDELELFRTSASMSAKDFVQKVQDLREELAEEHQRHIREVQDRARQDLEVKLTELQARHNHEMEQALQLQQRRTHEALEQQHQELEKLHKTEINQLRMRHQQEIDRLRSEELASLTDASVAQRLHADISATQQMDQRMLGTLASEVDSDAADIGRPGALPAQLQALLDRLREAGEHILSVSELDLLQRHLISGSSDDDNLREAREAEKLSLVKTVHALKELLSQADRVNAGLEETSVDWRSDLIHALVEVYRQERLGLEAELHTLRLLQHGQENARTIKNLDNRLHEQARLHQSGLDAMLRSERQSLLTEIEDLQSRLSQHRRELQDLRSQNAEALAQQEENAANKTWKLQREVQVLEYKLQQEKVIEEDLRKGLETERRRVAELSSEVSHDKGTLISVQSELQSTQLHLSRTKDALEREQNRFNSVTDALEEEREKNNHLSEKLESLRRQLNSLESGAGRTEAMRKERENANSRFIKELQAELKAEREKLHQMTEKAEEEWRQRKQVQAEMEKEQQVTDLVKQELDKLRHQTKRAVDTEASKLADLQRVMQQEKEQTKELQLLLEDRDNSIHHQSIRIQQLLDQVQQLQSTMGTMQQQMDAERKKGDKLAVLLEGERQQQQSLQDQEQAVAKQLRLDLSQSKADCAEARHLLELEKSRADNLRLEVDRVQSEMRAMTQHVGATEKQLETEHSSTWNKLRATQRDRDDLQVKVHELEMEMERLQDRLQDLELELDRSRQRELEARHDVERYKLYPSPRSNPNTPRGAGDAQLQSRLNTFCHKLQSMGQRLQTLTLQQRDHNSITAESAGSNTETSKRAAAVEALMTELQALQKKMATGSDQVDSGNELEELMQKLEVHQATINQLKAEKEELRRRLQLLEDEDNMRTPRTPRTQTIQRNHQPGGMPQYVSDSTTSDEEFLYERTVWANERLNLQMALDTAEHEIDHLKKELRAFRGRFNSEGFMVDVDREKMQRLYGKYLRAESFRKALVYQKKYLLLLLGGYQDTEQETLAVIATMGGQPSSTFDLAQRRRHRRLYTIFRSAARSVVAIFRMKYLVQKWRRAVRVGTPVVGGQVNQQYGYVATHSTYTSPNNTDIQRPVVSSSTSAHVHTLTRLNSPGLVNGNVVLTVDAGRRFYTPPTKEVSQSAPKVANTSSSSSAARRQLMSELGASGGEADSQSSPGRGDARPQGDAHDDFIQRLENLQSRLSGSGSSHNGEPSQQRSSWR